MKITGKIQDDETESLNFGPGNFGSGEDCSQRDVFPGEKLYYAAIRADEKFQRLLIKEHGKKASDVRYMSHLHSPEITQARDEMIRAFNLWKMYEL